MEDDQAQKRLEQAQMLMDLDRYDQAIKILMDLHGRIPNYEEVCRELTKCFISTKRPKEALEFACKLIELDPDNPYSHYHLAMAYRCAGKKPQALEAIDQAIALEPNEELFYGAKALFYIDHKKYGLGLHYADQGLAIQPDNYWCLCHKVLCLTNLGDTNALKSAVDEAMQLYPNSGYMHYILGWYYIKKVEPHKAREYFETALRIDPASGGYESDLLRALRDSSPLKYFGLKINQGFKKYAVWIIGTLVILFVAERMLERQKMPAIFAGLGFILVLMVYILGRMSMRLGDNYMNLYLWVKPDTRHLINTKERSKGIALAAASVGVIIALIVLGPIVFAPLLLIFIIMDNLA